MIKRFIKRLIGAGDGKPTRSTIKNTVRAGTKSSTRQGAQRARTRAHRAARTRVQTAAATRRVGTKAKLNGKDVYWGGKDWGWQSKESLTKITSSKTKPRVKGQAPKPNHATPPPKKGEAPQGTRNAANNSRTITARGSRAAELRARAQASRTRTSNRSTRTRTDPDTGNRVATAPGVSRPPGSPRRGTNRPVKPTAAEARRSQLVKDRDIGAKAAAARTPKSTSKTAEQARGSSKNRGGGSEPIDTRKSQRASQERAQQTRRASQLGKDAQKGRQVRLSASDAREAADKYEIDRMKEITKTARTMEGRAASDYVKAQKKLMKQEAARIRKNARNASLTSRSRNANNRSPSVAYQEPGKTGRTWRDRQTQKGAERLSADMTGRKERGELKTPRATGVKAGMPASNREGLKTGTPKPPSHSNASKNNPVNVTSRTGTGTGPQKAAQLNQPSKGIGPKGGGPSRQRTAERAQDVKAGQAQRQRNQSSQPRTTRDTAQQRATQRAEGARRANGRSQADRDELRANTDKSSTKSGRSAGATTRAQQAVSETRRRQAVRDAANKALQKEFMSNF